MIVTGYAAFRKTRELKRCPHREHPHLALIACGFARANDVHESDLWTDGVRVTAPKFIKSMLKGMVIPERHHRVRAIYRPVRTTGAQDAEYYYEVWHRLAIRVAMPVVWASRSCYDFKYPSTYITAAATIYDGIIYVGMRHNICYRAIQEAGLVYDSKLETGSGFINNHNEYLTREEALVLARKNGQLRNDRAKEILYSEDLW